MTSPEIADFFAAHVQDVRNGSDGQRSGKCPFHEDRQASFSFNVEKGVWKCHAGCGEGGLKEFGRKLSLPESSVPSLDVRFNLSPNGTKVEPDIVKPPSDAPPPSMQHSRLGAVSSSWCYRDADREPLFYVARYDVEGGKQIIPWSWDGSRWIAKAWPTPRPLYGLDRLSREPGKPVLVVEGEKACEAARTFVNGYAVVTWPGGAKALSKIDLSPLHGRKLLLWPDADEPGKAAMLQIGSTLVGYCPEIKLLDVQGQPDGWDAADAVDGGWGWDQFAEWARPRAKVFEPVDLKEVPLDEAAEVGGGQLQGRSPALVRAEWLEGRAFLPAVLAQKVARERSFLTSPIDAGGVGVLLHAYANGVFRPDGADIARRRINELLGVASKNDRIEGTVALIKENSKAEPSNLNPDAMDLLNIQNGMLDWRTGELKQHSPKYCSTFQIAARFSLGERSEILDRFLAEVFPSDALQLAEELVGYLLRPTTNFQKAFMLLGEGANGKSTFLSMLMAFLGPDNVSNVSLQDLSENRFKVAELLNKLVNVYADLPSKSVEQSDMFKNIVGGDPITAERKNCHPFKFFPKARLLFSANDLPRSHDLSPAYFRRWVIIPFPNKFEGVKAKKDMLELLTTEQARSALLNRAVEGLRRLEAQQAFTVCASVQEAGQTYRRQCDSAFEFISERLGTDLVSSLGKKAVYLEYSNWVPTAGLGAPVSQRVFNRRLGEVLGVVEKRVDGARFWAGLTWKVEGGA